MRETMVLDHVHIASIFQIMKKVCDTICFNDENNKEGNISILLQNLRIITVSSEVTTTLIDDDLLYKVDRIRIAKSSIDSPTTYAIDSGCTNPITFANGTTMDVCHAGIAVIPPDFEIERYRSLTSVIYTPDVGITFPQFNWESYDYGYARKSQIVLQKHSIQTRIPNTVHDIAIYYSESEHLKWILEKTQPDKSDFIYMDGSVYPKQLMYWVVINSDDLPIRYDPLTTKILQNYVDIVDYCIEKQVPLVGFVKNPAESQIIRSDLKKEIDIWTNDTQMFRCLLDNLDSKEFITYTGWFHQHRRLYGTSLSKASPLVGGNIKGTHQESDYDTVFFMIYIPVENIVFKVESVYGLVKDPKIRDLITEKVLHDISIDLSVPPALQHADFVAKISAKEKSKIYDMLGSMKLTTYNEKRWPEHYEDEV
ncbi:DNA double-strand break repair nuclease NurA [Methanosarcina mazei]|uniref:Nuclease n=1 Tax=Methanosarcina mazei TaxID=2209 RepID=A0A4P8R4G2_METMZ|nr:DNA double-strand break repair nuclease NurA [Methanosarcina mazei]QCR14824.1 nuclease [Methanosarcina mazei]